MGRQLLGQGTLAAGGSAVHGDDDAADGFGGLGAHGEIHNGAKAAHQLLVFGERLVAIMVGVIHRHRIHATQAPWSGRPWRCGDPYGWSTVPPPGTCLHADHSKIVAGNLRWPRHWHVSPATIAASRSLSLTRNSSSPCMHGACPGRRTRPPTGWDIRRSWTARAPAGTVTPCKRGMLAQPGRRYLRRRSVRLVGHRRYRRLHLLAASATDRCDGD